MTIRLLNAAVMPREGKYSLIRLDPDDFAYLVRRLRPVSYIGYRNCQDMIESLCDVPIELCRESTPVEDGDTLLICRLKYRVGNPAVKGFVQATVDDYEFFFCVYRE